MYQLPHLPYDYSALEPHIDARTMEIHHSKHHHAYVNNLNKALENYPELQTKPLNELLSNPDSLPKKGKTAILNHGGGHYNHSLFWQIISPNGGSQPTGELNQTIIQTFNSYQKFQDQFSHLATTLFGSGWTWLAVDTNKELQILNLPNQDSPLSQNMTPILGIDVWEHAYYLKYQNRRADYIKVWWNIVNWDAVTRNFNKAIS